MVIARRRPARWWALALLGIVLAGCAHTLSGSAQPGTSTVPIPSATPTVPTSTAVQQSTPAPPTPGSSPSASPSAGAAPSTVRTSWALGPRITNAGKNAYGDYEIRPGQVAGLYDSTTGQDLIAWVVDSLTLDRPCAKDSDATSENGHFLFLTMRIELRNAATQTLTDANIGFTNDNWDAFDAKGVAQPATGGLEADQCVAENLRPPDVSKLVPGKPVSAVVVLDVRATSGTVLLHFLNIDAGWEYHYG